MKQLLEKDSSIWVYFTHTQAEEIMRGWIKYFSDNSEIIGEDNLVKAKKVSWTNSSFDNLSKVSLFHDEFVVTFSGDLKTKLHQSDSYLFKFFKRTSIPLYRRLQYRISKRDKYIILTPTYNGLEAKLVLNVNELKEKEQIIELTEEHAGSWFTLEIDLNEKIITAEFLDKKI
jgi:hypothetical protein